MTEQPDQRAAPVKIPIWSSWPSRILSLWLAFSMFSMMALIFVDVIGRYVFNSPVLGAYEVIQYLMASVIFSGVPIVTANRQHITVGVLDPVLGDRSRWALELLGLVFSLVVVAFIAYRLWLQGESLRRVDYITLVLKIPLAPVAYYASILCAVTAGILVVMVGQHISKGWSH